MIARPMYSAKSNAAVLGHEQVRYRISESFSWLIWSWTTPLLAFSSDSDTLDERPLNQVVLIRRRDPIATVGPPKMSDHFTAASATSVVVCASESIVKSLKRGGDALLALLSLVELAATVLFWLSCVEASVEEDVEREGGLGELSWISP